MNRILEFTQANWLQITLLVAAIAGAVITVWRRWRQASWAGWATATVVAAAFAVGGLVPFPTSTLLGINVFAAWIVALAFLVFVILLMVLVLSGAWSDILAAVTGIVLTVGLGGVFCTPLAGWLKTAGRLLLSLQPLYLWWLLLLLLLPLIVLFSFRSLSGLGPVRKWVAIGLRCTGIALLVLAVAETHARHYAESLTVLFVWDRSLSVPQEPDRGEDLRTNRIRDFINNAVASRPPRRNNDRIGMIVFGKEPRLELPPGSVPKLNFKKIVRTVDPTYTNIGGSIKLALASFPEGTGKRIVLISDGNENLGDALEQAQIAKNNGVQIDVVVQTTSHKKRNEVLVERLEAPPVTEKGSRLPLRIVLRSHHPAPVSGKLKIIRTSLKIVNKGKGDEADAVSQPILDQEVTLRPGLNTFFFQQPGTKQDESYIYEAQFLPFGLPGDRFENNHAEATVVARGQRSVMLIEEEIGKHQQLVDRLRFRKPKLKLIRVTPERLPQNPRELALILSSFDSVVLANVPADKFSEDQQKVFRSNTHDQGCGLVMIGGPNGFGAGGWKGTEVEKALPVTCDLKSTKVEGKSGLVLIMHASEMAQGNMWQKKIAKIAITKLSRVDMVGLLYFDWQGGGHKWHIPFQQIGDNRPAILKRLDSMMPGDMPDADPSLRKARDALSDPKHALGTKHIIFISDGDHWTPPVRTLLDIKRRKITCTTVCITTHGQGEYKRMSDVAALTGGRSYPRPVGGVYRPLSPSQLPAIYIKEARLVSKAFVYQKQFTPLLLPLGPPTDGLPEDLQPLYGFVRTTKRASPLVSVPIQTPKIGKEGAYPILAYWQYGLGKAVAFTSDALTNVKKGFWDRDWRANTVLYDPFWEQVVVWSMRAVETGQKLQMTTEHKDGKVRITIDARDDKKRPLTNVKLQAGVTSPSMKGKKLLEQVKFEQVNAGVYEAEIDAEEDGAYFINVRAQWKDQNGKPMFDGIRAGVTVPYPPEFAEMTSNVALLQQIAEITGGKVYGDSENGLADVAESGEVFRDLDVQHVSMQPIWFWLVFLAAICLVGDVAVRRIIIDFKAPFVACYHIFLRMRGMQAAVVREPEFLDRLKSRKSRIGESLEKERAARRFETEETYVEAPAGAMDVSDAPARLTQRYTKPAPQVAPEKEGEPADYASRLLKAKKRVQREFDKDKQ